MARRMAFLALLLAWPLGAQALEFRGCDERQQAFAGTAAANAAELAMMASAAVADDAIYAAWFGTYSQGNAEQVRATLKAVHRVLTGDNLILRCPAVGVDGCDRDTYANVLTERPYVVNLCGSYFTQPSVGGVVVTSYAFENGTREGTLIHEISHFAVVAGTEDHCYGREECGDMAKTDPQRAIENADTMQYYAEDVMLTREGRLSR